MRILLISLNRETEPFTAAPLGMALVAGALERAGHEVRALDLLFSEDAASDVTHAVSSFTPEFIGLSIRNIESSTEFLMPAYREIAGLIRGCTNAPVAAGGPGFSIMPKPALEYLGLEIGVVGEGEETAILLARALQEGREPEGIPGVCTLKDGRYSHVPAAPMEDLSKNPFPAWKGLPVGRYDMVGVQGKRGCSFGCVYCTYPQLEGRRMRLRPPSDVADEMARSSGAEAFYFVDNLFNNPRSHAEGVCRAIVERGLDVSWGCLVSPVGLDRPFIELMQSAGCASVEIGADSLSDKMLQNLGKAFKKADVEESVQACKEAGMMHMVFLILGGPGEDEDSLKETFDALERLSPDKVFAVAGIRIYPGTAIAGVAAREGIIKADDALFEPAFYASKKLGDRLYERADEFFARHPDWIYYPANGIAAQGQAKPVHKAEWDHAANEFLEKALSAVPRLLRPIARKSVTKKAAELAASRGIGMVGPDEVREAFILGTPAPFQSAMKESFRKLGLLDG